MQRIALIVAVFATLVARPAHADTLDFTWQSEAWVKTYESPTQFTISGPFSLSGTGTVSFSELAAGGRMLTFGGSYGGTLLPTGDGTYNGPFSFPTSVETRTGLGVLTPTADGFTVVVHRAASGPDAGAAFFGVATHASGGGTSPSATASEPAVLLAVAVAFVAAARLAAPRRRV
jgi:hypothetical protein